MCPWVKPTVFRPKCLWGWEGKPAHQSDKETHRTSWGVRPPSLPSHSVVLWGSSMRTGGLGGSSLVQQPSEIQPGGDQYRDNHLERGWDMRHLRRTLLLRGHRGFPCSAVSARGQTCRQGTKKSLFEIPALFYGCALATAGQGRGKKQSNPRYSHACAPGLARSWDF